MKNGRNGLWDRRWTGGIVLAIVLIGTGGPACSSNDEDEGKCNVVTYPVRGTSYSETDTYCGGQAACDAYCASVKGNPDVGSCSYEAAKYCSGGSIPASGGAAKPFCALMRKLACGSDLSSAESEPYCDPYCSTRPGSSESDDLGGTTCYTQYGSTVVEGTSCDDAIAKLTGE